MGIADGAHTRLHLASDWVHLITRGKHIGRLDVGVDVGVTSVGGGRVGTVGTGDGVVVGATVGVGVGWPIVYRMCSFGR